jgi:hypothetical protein
VGDEPTEGPTEEPTEEGGGSKWTVPLVTTGIAIVGAIAIALWTYHVQQASDFGTAQGKCREAITPAAAFLDSAAFLASKHSPTDPGAPDNPRLVELMNNVGRDCFNKTLASTGGLKGDDWQQFDAHREQAFGGWTTPWSVMPGAKPLNQVAFEITHDYLLDELEPKIDGLKAPTIVQSVWSVFS